MIRNATIDDAQALANIYAHYVLATTITYETEPPGIEEMANRWKNISANYPYLVMEEQGKVIGYAYAGRFRERKAFDPTTEVSIYFHKDYCGKGRGPELMNALFQELEKYPYATAVACISSNNDISAKFCKNMGFVFVGILENVGYKMNQWLGLAEYTKKLRDYNKNAI
ncbi:MAG: GNAT family N-acetyltransferase [Acidaminococcaceae bacterium]|nr:GNAT family N-acetyltransferase [Acidaminococcaceae bacterium]MDD4721583.1 GNAT family N-acetyltransferase [Acidaminococcaceae bacterium]